MSTTSWLNVSLIDNEISAKEADVSVESIWQQYPSPRIESNTRQDFIVNSIRLVRDSLFRVDKRRVSEILRNGIKSCERFAPKFPPLISRGLLPAFGVFHGNALAPRNLPDAFLRRESFRRSTTYLRKSCIQRAFYRRVLNGLSAGESSVSRISANLNSA